MLDDLFAVFNDVREHCTYFKDLPGLFAKSKAAFEQHQIKLSEKADKEAQRAARRAARSAKAAAKTPKAPAPPTSTPQPTDPPVAQASEQPALSAPPSPFGQGPTELPDPQV